MNDRSRKKKSFFDHVVDSRSRESLKGGDSISALPEIDSLLTYRSLTYTTWHALGEFVDNAITSFAQWVSTHPQDERFEKLLIEISWDSSLQKLTITDNAAGIPLTSDGWGRALKVGARNPDPGFLGVHGYGMKAAGLWWAPSIQIISNYVEDDVEVSATLDPDALVASQSHEIPLDIKPAKDPKAHGTQIILRGLNQSRSYPVGMTLGKVRTYLASMYRTYLRGDEGFVHPRTKEKWLSIRVLGQALEYATPEILKEPFWPNDLGPEKDAPSILWRRDYELELPNLRHQQGVSESKTLIVKGWVGVMSKMRRKDAGIFLAFRGKGVMGIEQGGEAGSGQYKPVEIFGASNLWRAARLIGEFDVSPFGKSVTTDSASWSDEEEEAFIGALLEAIKDPEFPIFQMANNFRVHDKEGLSTTEQQALRKGLTELSREASAISESLPKSFPPETSAEIDRPKPEAQKLIPSDELISLANGTSVRLQIAFIKGDDWLTIYPGDPIDVILNSGHPFVTRFWNKPSAALSIVHFALALVTAELEDPSVSQLRDKLNHWLMMAGHASYNMADFVDDED